MDTGRTLTQPRGAALVIAMLVMAVLLLAGTAFLTVSSTEHQIARTDQIWTQAFLLAEAGIHKAIAQFNANASYTGETGTPLAGGTFTTRLISTEGCTPTSARHVLATASHPVLGGTARVLIRATIDRVSYPFRWAAFATLPKGSLALDSVLLLDRTNKELWLAANTLVDSFDSSHGPYHAETHAGRSGSIGANGGVRLDGNSEIKGNVKAGDAIDVGGGVSVSGLRLSQAGGEEFPPVAPDGSASEDLVVPSGSKQLVAGTYHFANVYFEDDTSLVLTGAPVTMYVSGEVSLGQNVTMGSHPGTQLRIITRSDGPESESATFKAGDNLRFYGSLYGRNTDVYLGQHAEVFGSILARTFYAGSFAKIHLDQAMAQQAICHNGKATIRRGTWRQVASW